MYASCDASVGVLEPSVEPALKTHKAQVAAIDDGLRRVTGAL